MLALNPDTSAYLQPPLTAAEVMMPEPSRSTTPDVVRRYRNAQSADVGERSR